jgi:hypothetical protein
VPPWVRTGTAREWPRLEARTTGVRPWLPKEDTMSCLLLEPKEFAIGSAWSYETEFERLRVREMGVTGCYR